MSKDPNKRLKDHIYDSKRERTKKGNWIRKLVNNGLKPILVILEETDVENCAYWEEYHIKKLIGEGNVLLNYDDKDEGTHLRYAKESGHSRLLDFGNSKRGSNTEFRTPKPEWVVIIRIDLSVSD